MGKVDTFSKIQLEMCEKRGSDTAFGGGESTSQNTLVLQHSEAVHCCCKTSRTCSVKVAAHLCAEELCSALVDSETCTVFSDAPMSLTYLFKC